MSSRKIPDDIRQAAVEDYKTSGDPYAVVAARHGISKSRLNALVRGPGAKRKPRTWGADEIGLTGGRWVNVRGVMRWETA